MNEMPVKPNDQSQPVQTPQTPQEAHAEAAQAPQACDKTIPGGRYVVGGQVVDANGEPIKE